jgi:hypothetical protein
MVTLQYKVICRKREGEAFTDTLQFGRGDVDSPNSKHEQRSAKFHVHHFTA